MSELIHTHDNRATIRWKLLTGASALALTAYVSSAGVAKAEDTNQPLIWIELGGQLNRLDDNSEMFAPQFILKTPRPAPETVSPLGAEHPPLYGFDEDGKLSFQPQGTGWVFSASIRFGRSTTHKHLHQQSYPTKPIRPPLTPSANVPFQYALPFSDADHKDSETHAILDFQAGKDVGIGMFGHDSMSVFSVGVRFAQLSGKSHTAFKSQPDFHLGYKYFSGLKLINNIFYHSNAATAATAQSFHGIGPSLSWNASVPFAGNSRNGELTFDWGVNGALLFGRQRTKVHHQTTQYYHTGKNYTIPPKLVYQKTPPDQIRSRSITVPNVGGFAGISFKYDNAKLSFGYRADFFFNAIDGGIDARKSEDRGFYGPFASISIGLGD